MSRMHRAGMAVVIGALAVGAASTARAQVEGMPLFTNPRYATGIRVHADIGLPTDTHAGLGDYNVLQGGASLALGPVGIDANVGMTRTDFGTIQNNDVGTQTKANVSALLQLRLAGAGSSPLSLSIFGGGSVDVTAYGFSSLPDSIKNQLGGDSKVVTIPAGVAVGIKLPLVVINPNLWGSARMNFHKIINCPSGTACPNGKADFRWAVGLDIPILSIISLRAAYDAGKIAGQTVDYFGLGASIGLGGVR
jgi:hypothetical protein